jgi:hypothetical protein
MKKHEGNLLIERRGFAYKYLIILTYMGKPGGGADQDRTGDLLNAHQAGVAQMVRRDYPIARRKRGL